MSGPSARPGATRPTGPTSGLAVAGAAIALVLHLGAVVPAAAATFYVDNTNPTCSNSGPGTLATPHCTITAAAALHPGAGNTIEVLAGTYREQVSVPAGGAAGNPFVIRASNPAVTVTGADDFSSAAQWTQVAGDVWLASSVSWAPKQVFADGLRLTPSTVTPATMPPRTFQYVAGAGLYVHAGGGNPAGHGTQVGRRNYGFTLSGRPYVVVRGFTTRHTEDKGFLVQSASHQVEITDNRATLSFKAGIQVIGSNNCLVARNTSSDNGLHGIALTGGSTGCTVEDNETFGNADPTVRVANGIYLFGAPANLLQRNRIHHNQDSGVHIQSGSNDCVSVQNRSWSNGDHGFDHLGSTGTLHVGDVAWGNSRDGFSIEGTSPGTQLFNCIMAENGLTTNEFDLWVDASSAPGFVSDYNVIWNSTAQPPIKYINFTPFATVGEYSAASGQDVNTIQADPLFVNPAGGDFRLQAGSPAIDNANSSVTGWPALDAAGLPRLDDPGSNNAGAGPVAFADRGAYEYPPIVFSVLPSTGTAPLAVTANASGSYGPNGAAVSYRFDFGDGAVAGPQPGPTATHTYAAGTWTASVTVTDAAGGTGTGSATVIATAPNVNVVDRRVAAGSDDAEESASGKSTVNNADLDLVYDKSNQTVGMRFSSVGIPQNAIIQSAWVQFTSRDSRSEATSLTIRGQAADNPAAFTTSNNNVSSRPRTTASVGWAPAAWSSGQAGANQRTPDLTAVIDEIVRRPGWANGNAIALIVTGTGHRTAWAYDGSTSSAPLLHVEYANNYPPTARLSLQQTATPALTVLADASASTDPDPAPIASYRFTFGDGTPAVTVAAPAATAQHTYAAPGVYSVTVTATDTRGLVSAPVTSSITVNAAPTARLTLRQLSTPPHTVTADAAASTDTDAMPIVSYRFTFGDGSPSVTVPAPAALAQHTYATAGAYTVTVTATDAGGLTGTATASITVNPAPVARITVTQPATPPLTVNADGATSTDADGIASYRFDFGDGTPAVTTTAPVTTAPHTYAAPGVYTVSLVATDHAGFVSLPATRSFTVNQAPVARLSVAQPFSPPLTVNANASASTDTDAMPIATYRFDFGDGTPAVTVNAPAATASHAYAAAGTFVVTVTVTDLGGLASTATASITLETAPTARLAVTQVASPALTVSADASASTDNGPIASYRFDFGDGTPAVVTNAPATLASHTYATAGTYTVTLTATDAAGFVSTPASLAFAVNGAPTARLSAAVAPSPPLTVNADASASTDTDAMPIASYRFEWGDGTPATTTSAPVAVATHTYAAAGTYSVRLTATDLGGLTSAPVTSTVVLDAAPTAGLAVALLPSPPMTVRADGSTSSANGGSPIASYRFEWGDGTAATTTTAPTASAQHTYASAGNYTVRLTVTNTGGLASTQAIATVAIQSGVDVRVVASSDDSEENANGKPTANSDDLELVFDGSNQVVGMRWAGITIPRGALVTRAWIQFAAKESHSEATSLTFRGQAADNAGSFTGSNGNISNRPRTTASMAWAPAAWTAGQAGASQRTPELAPVIQEIVNRTGWASGNALVIIVTGTGHRTAWSYNGNSSLAPLLHIEYAPQEGAPVARLTVTQAASPPLTVNADGSASTDTDSSPIASYRFDFGDGTPPVTTTAPTAIAPHTYAAAGTYTVTLTATDTGGRASAPATVAVTVAAPNAAPVARLTVSQIASPALTVRADGSASTDTDSWPIATYRFNFGDGTPVVTTTAPTAIAQHTYAAPGTYTVTLTATDTGGLVSAPATASITVNPPAESAPTARLTVTQTASPPFTANADGSASTDPDSSPIASYRFDWGDGTAATTTTAPTATAQHTYAAAGTYTVTLIATDTGGRASAPATASITLSGPTTLERRIAGWIDDAEEAAGGTIFVNSSDLELVADGSVQQTVGMRWPGLAIPPGATITAAWIQFVSKEAQSVATSLTFRAEAADNAPQFGSAAFNLSARARTTAEATWAPVAWAAGDSGANQRTPDLKAVLQEVVSRPGWASGNAIAIVVTGTGRRTVWAYDGNAAAAPLLHVEFATGGAAQMATLASPREDHAAAGASAGGVEAANARPAHLALSPAYPNPVAGPVSFRLELPAMTRVRWGIYDVQGRSLWSEDRTFDAGRTELSWNGRAADGRPVKPGMYFARVDADTRVLIRRFVRL